MKKALVSAALLYLGFAFAAEAEEAKNPDLVLPGMVFEIESLPPEDFTPVLPAAETPRPYLPPPDPGIAPEPPVPDAVLGADAFPAGAAAVPAGESSVFARGTLGAGSMNGILGELSVAKTGGGTRFRAAFSHDGADGYDFRDPGTGFFRRDDRVEARLDMDAAGGTVLAGASYRETEEGLQRLSPVYSAITRFAEADLAVILWPAERVSLRLGGNGACAGRVLSSSAAAPPAVDREGGEYSGRAGAELGYEAGKIRLSLSARYGFRLAPDDGDLSARRFDVSASGKYVPREGWSLDASGGVFWNGGDPVLPFSAGVSGGAGDLFTFGIRGGFRADEYDYRDLWKDLGLLRLQGDLEDGFAWFGEIAVGAKTRDDRLSFAGNFKALRREDAIKIEDFDAPSAAFPFHRENMLSFLIGGEIGYRLFSGFSVFGAGGSVLGDRAFRESAHRYEPGLRFLSGSGKYGFTLSAAWNTGDETAAPDLRWQGVLKPAEGLEFSLAAFDLLAPLMEETRISAGPFAAPGFRVMLKTTVSF